MAYISIPTRISRPHSTERRSNVFSRILAAFIASREAEARRQAAFYLLRLDDQALESLGHSRAELARDARGAVPHMGW